MYAGTILLLFSRISREKDARYAPVEGLAPGEIPHLSCYA